MQVTYRMVQPSDIAHRKVLLLSVLITEVTATTFSVREYCFQYKYLEKIKVSTKDNIWLSRYCKGKIIATMSHCSDCCCLVFRARDLERFF